MLINKEHIKRKFNGSGLQVSNSTYNRINEIIDDLISRTSKIAKIKQKQRVTDEIINETINFTR